MWKKKGRYGLSWLKEEWTAVGRVRRKKSECRVDCVEEAGVNGRVRVSRKKSACGAEMCGGKRRDEIERRKNGREGQS